MRPWPLACQVPSCFPCAHVPGSVIVQQMESTHTHSTHTHTIQVLHVDKGTSCITTYPNTCFTTEVCHCMTVPDCTTHNSWLACALLPSKTCSSIPQLADCPPESCTTQGVTLEAATPKKMQKKQSFRSWTLPGVHIMMSFQLSGIIFCSWEMLYDTVSRANY